MSLILGERAWRKLSGTHQQFGRNGEKRPSKYKQNCDFWIFDGRNKLHLSWPSGHLLFTLLSPHCIHADWNSRSKLFFL